ncbi:hybrid sensor histidine kinase/response regulator [Desulfopila aestuarii]|uniref:histidine kinase n=1 Tax=Desulfopila aestuarii DSM 18488 TaxID=1121416 RepID=A0A1M7YLA2_9BACT|nr:PAS domain-containing sensor histidine kinase [Desulfopila aestuarii]SHO53376.1 His Kinase A (phospho-acceptor) domain-containing protein [Desulfopila aestuarii DSM 18488]
MKSLTYFSLKYKLLIFSIAVSACLTALLAIVEINYDIEMRTNNTKLDFLHFETNHKQYLANQLWAMEYDSLAAFIKNQVDQEHISAIEISDLRGNRVAAAGRFETNMLLEWKFELTYYHNNQSIKIGEVILQGILPTFPKVIKERWQDVFLVNGLMVVIIFFSSYLLFYWSVLGRILKITQFVSSVSPVGGEPPPMLPSSSGIPDEISLLTAALHERTERINNEMTNRIIAEEKVREKNIQLTAEIQERQFAEQVLKASKETYISILNGIEAAIYVADIKTHEILFANKYLIESFGGDMTGSKCFDALRKRSEQCPDCTNPKLLDRNGNPFGVCVWHGQNPVNLRWYLNYDRAIKWTDGRIVRIQIGTDITDLKEMEEKLRQSQKMESIGMLAGGIAHDFNNILGAILGYSEMVQEECPIGSPMRSDIDKVIKASHRAKELVKQILAFSRQADSEKIVLQPALILKEAMKMLRASLPKTIDIRQNIDLEAGLVFADPTQVHQIITNLCTNAFHAMEKTGGILDISLQSKELDLADLVSEPHVQPGRFVEISVGDTGSGIAPELMDKIFDPFFTTKEVGKGTGMGLAIIHGITQKYGGFISCKSSPGEGTTFNVYLPVHAETSLPEAEATLVEMIQTGIEHILFIDDEEMLAEMGKTMLERLGYRVTVETNSIEALKIIQNQPDRFDLVITDQTMPGMTGSDLARRILQIRPNLPIILCTGFSNLISEEKARIYGIKGFAMKPLAKKDLATLIRKVLDGEEKEG